MFRRSATLRISFTLASITLCALLAALALGLFPDRIAAIAQGRVALCEAVAVNCALVAERGEWNTLESILRTVTKRNRDVLSAAMRRADGRLVVVSGNHERRWPKSTTRSTLTRMQVPISVNESPWGRLELHFAEPDESNWTPLPTSVLRLALFVIPATLLGTYLYLRRVLQHLDPSKVIPERVRTTLDTLAEGLLVLDRDQRIVLANKAFAHTVGQCPEDLQGRRASELPWSDPSDGAQDAELPWERAIQNGAIEKGHVVKLGSDETTQRILQVNSAPILGDNGESRGAIASFSDVTLLEMRNIQLGKTLTRLQQSRDQIADQNEQLQILATTDPLTKCLNRRAFFQQLESALANAARSGRPISYVIMDIDHFKLVNDNHGHKVGDDVLEQVGKLVQEIVQDQGLVCRYGGEEFSILVPESDVADTVEIADTIRKRIESVPIADLKITSSFGVAEFDVDSGEPLHTLERADKALYFAKRSGRNSVVRWDHVPADFESREPARKPETPVSAGGNAHIPFTAVAVLVSALDHRNAETAQHSRRVANLCVAMADGLMSEEQRYVLEVAALLHDMGKLSVPDSILQKPGPLTPKEWKVMNTHLRLGEKTVENAFANQDLVDVLRNYRASYGGSSHSLELPIGDDIPLCARILHIADAYDAMTSRRAYRDALSKKEAFAELKRCAGNDFDPDLVERCINVIESCDQGRSTPTGGVCEDTVARVGMLLEKLVCAIDGEDLTSVKTMVDHMRVITQGDGGDEIAELAEQLSQQIDDEAPWADVLQSTLNLLDLCRQWQQVNTLSSELAIEAQQAVQ